MCILGAGNLQARDRERDRCGTAIDLHVHVSHLWLSYSVYRASVRQTGGQAVTMAHQTGIERKFSHTCFYGSLTCVCVCVCSNVRQQGQCDVIL